MTCVTEYTGGTGPHSTADFLVLAFVWQMQTACHYHFLLILLPSDACKLLLLPPALINIKLSFVPSPRKLNGKRMKT